VGTHTDVTEIVLKEAVEAKANFVARMSHEIRSPMCAILHQCELYQEDRGNRGEFIESIVQSCSYLLEVSENIMAISKSQKCSLRALNVTKTKLESIMNNVVCSHKGGRIGVVLSRDDASVGHLIQVDVPKLLQILNNLVSNALKYSKPDSKVILEGSVKSDDNDKHILTFRVTDKGFGIHEDKWEAIFSEFYQLDSSCRGIGLGLHISKKLARMMSGELFVSSSKLGEGTTMVLEVPVNLSTRVRTKSAFAEKKGANQRSTSAQSLMDISNDSIPVDAAGLELHQDASKRETRGDLNLDAQQPAQRLRILNVDDIKVNRKIIRKKIQAAAKAVGMLVDDIVDASDGQEAVDLYVKERGKFDLILMDCLMPVKDGFQATKEIRMHSRNYSLPRSPRVVAVTASVSDRLEQQCRNSGMKAVVHKPCKTGVFQSILTRLVQ